MIKTTNPLKRSAWAVFLYRGRQVRLYLLRNSNLVDKERMVELLARRYMTEPESIVVDDDFESILSVAEQAEKMARNEYSSAADAAAAPVASVCLAGEW